MPEHFGSLCAYEHVSTPTHTMFINNCVQVHMVACVHAPSCHDPSASKITRIRCILPSVQTMTYIKWQAPGNSLLLAYLIFVQRRIILVQTLSSVWGFSLPNPSFTKDSQQWSSIRVQRQCLKQRRRTLVSPRATYYHRQPSGGPYSSDAQDQRQKWACL